MRMTRRCSTRRSSARMPMKRPEQTASLRRALATRGSSRRCVRRQCCRSTSSRWGMCRRASGWPNSASPASATALCRTGRWPNGWKERRGRPSPASLVLQRPRPCVVAALITGELQQILAGSDDAARTAAIICAGGLRFNRKSAAPAASDSALSR